jgi:CubicO group peptidase (beta-lactamase class C family)
MLFMGGIKFYWFLMLMLRTTIITDAQIDTKQIAQLNEYFDFVKNAGFSSQILIAEKGKVAASRSFGYANEETQYPVSSTTSFNISSITKQFTAVATLWLEQHKKMKTSDTLGKFWDTLPHCIWCFDTTQLINQNGWRKKQAYCLKIDL